MASWTAEEVYEGIEQWIKARRDEYTPDAYGADAHYVIDKLLDELRDNGIEGFFPWQRMNNGDGEEA
ncbi:MAG TPA: hypothetical protein VIY48_10330 [Candidatus Paceibacterota bacterium]